MILGLLPEQFIVSLLRRVLDSRKEQLLVGRETVNQLVLIELAQGCVLLYLSVEILTLDDREFRRFDALEIEKARRVLVHTVEGSHKVALEEELKRDVLSLVIEEQAQTTFANQINLSRNPSAFQQYCL